MVNGIQEFLRHFKINVKSLVSTLTKERFA